VKAAAYSLTGVGEGNITVTSDETDVSIAMTWGSF
jgi:hypothetical protein